jgi:hypothetical protein
VLIVDQLIHVQATEHALIEKAHLRAVIGKPQAHAQVRFIGSVNRLHSELATHPQMGDERVLPRAREAERNPEELSSALRCREGLSAQGFSQRRPHLTANGARVQDVDVGHAAAGEPRFQSDPDGLHLG